MARRKEFFSTNLEPELLARLRALAKRLGCTQASLVANALGEYLPKAEDGRLCIISGCGHLRVGENFCATCHLEWLNSEECRSYVEGTTAHRLEPALAAFVRRVEAERTQEPEDIHGN